MGVENSSPSSENNLSKESKLQKRRRFIQLKVGKILGLKKQEGKSIDLPEHTLSRMFRKDTVELKKRFQVSKRLKGIDGLKTEFKVKKSLLDDWERNDKTLHELEILYYILLSQDEQFLVDQGVDANWIKQKYKIILTGAIQARVNEFDSRGKYTASKRKVPPIDKKKMKKIFQFRSILHNFGFTDEDIGVSEEKFNEIEAEIKKGSEKMIVSYP